MIPTGPTTAADDDCDNDRGVFSLSTLSDSLEVPSPPPKCDKDHDMEAILAGMKPNGDRSDFWCDICQALHLEDNCRVNYHCRICGDYDTCFSCAIIHTIQGTDEYRKLSFTYIGPLDDGEARGKGKRIYDDGSVYVGDFRDGNMHGTGTRTWPDGHIYVGEWRDGKRNGTGTLTLASGEMYVGEWRDNKYHGTGKLTRADGSVQDGQWEDGRPLPQNEI